MADWKAKCFIRNMLREETEKLLRWVSLGQESLGGEELYYCQTTAQGQFCIKVVRSALHSLEIDA